VVLANLPSMLHAIIASLVEAQPDMELVDAKSGFEVDALLGAGANVVIVGMEENQLPPAFREMLELAARITVLGVTDRGNNAVLYRLRPESLELGEVSPDELLAAMRSAARRPG
jgi:hypothetical protein